MKMTTTSVRSISKRLDNSTVCSSDSNENDMCCSTDVTTNDAVYDDVADRCHAGSFVCGGIEQKVKGVVDRPAANVCRVCTDDVTCHSRRFNAEHHLPSDVCVKIRDRVDDDDAVTDFGDVCLPSDVMVVNDGRKHSTAVGADNDGDDEPMSTCSDSVCDDKYSLSSGSFKSTSSRDSSGSSAGGGGSGADSIASRHSCLDPADFDILPVINDDDDDDDAITLPKSVSRCDDEHLCDDDVIDDKDDTQQHVTSTALRLRKLSEELNAFVDDVLQHYSGSVSDDFDPLAAAGSVNTCDKYNGKVNDDVISLCDASIDAVNPFKRHTESTLRAPVRRRRRQRHPRNAHLRRTSPQRDDDTRLMAASTSDDVKITSFCSEITEDIAALYTAQYGSGGGDHGVIIEEVCLSAVVSIRSCGL